MSEQSKDHSVARAAIIAIGLVTWATAQPLVPFADKTWLMCGGEAVGFGIAIVFLALEVGSTLALYASSVFIAVGMAILISVALGAEHEAKRADAECASIKSQMIGPQLHPEVAPIYQALGCHS